MKKFSLNLSVILQPCPLHAAIVVSVKDGKIVEKENYTSKLKKSSYGGMNTRVTYVGDYYYLLDNELDVSSFKLK